MKNNQTSATAYLIAESAVVLSHDNALAALLEPETVRLSRLFADDRPPFSKLAYLAKERKIFRPVFRRLEQLIIPGIQLHYSLRKRRIEEIARRALAENFRQIVVFGAGFDTLTLRLHKEFPGVDFVEVDYPATQAAKRKAIEKRGLAAGNLKFVALDLTEKSFSETLLSGEIFRREAKTLFIAEGLLMYLKSQETNDLFRFVNQQSAPGSRFAFTFMERRADGRIGFQNASKLVNFWLKIHGEPFLWGVAANELQNFLTARNFSLHGLDSAETFRRKYLNAPPFARLTLASGELLCVAETKKALVVNDVHSKLNETPVAEIVQPKNIREIQAAIKRARRENKRLSVAGGFHAMGGQQFLTGGILLDMSQMKGVLRFEPENEIIEVEAGIRWSELVDYTAAAQSGKENRVGIRQKQTGADNLSLGGALAANIHGRGLTMKPFIDDIESFCLVRADGEILNCSRLENAELFRLAVGGYGLFGVVASVSLRLTKRRKMRRIVKIEKLENLVSLFKRRVDDGFLYGDFQFAVASDSEDFLRKGVFSCYEPVDDDAPIDELQKELAAED